MKILGINIDLSKLDAKVKEMEDFIKKIEEVQRRAVGQMMKPPEQGKGEEKDKLSYIGWTIFWSDYTKFLQILSKLKLSQSNQKEMSKDLESDFSC